MNHTSSTAAHRRTTHGTHSRKAGAAFGLVALVAAGSFAVAAPARADSFTPAAAACAPAHAVDITGVDYSFSIDTHGTVPAGLVQINFTNNGPAPHQVQLFRLDDGVSYAKFLADLQVNRTTAMYDDSTSDGGVGDLAAPAERTVWETLQAGTYAVVSMVVDSTDTPDFAKGMVSEFTVAGQSNSGQSAATHPAAPVAGLITADGLSYSLPPVLLENAVYRFQNADTQNVHEFLIGKLLPGVTAAQAKTWLGEYENPGGPTGPQPFTLAGGYGGAAPQSGGWFQANLEPGNYIGFDLAPNDGTGAPNGTLGMVVGFTVAG